MSLLRYIVMTVLIAVLQPAIAQAAETHIRAALLAESAQPAPGRIVTLALAMTPDAGWHGYWQNPGDAGVEARLRWTLPAGFKVGQPRYPVPERLLISGLMNYVYEGRYALLVDLEIPRTATPGTRVPIRLDADWLACTDRVCVPERGTLTTNLVVGDGNIGAATRARFDGWRAALPRPLGSTARFARRGESVRLGIPLPATTPLADAYFFPLTDGAINYAAPQRLSRSGDMLIVEAKAGDDRQVREIRGVLKIGAKAGLTVRAMPGTVPASGTPVAAAGEGKYPPLGIIAATFGAALLGGLILNIMPCVFPILSLKALSLARANGHEADARRDALAYAAGVIAVCVGLGVGLLALRAGGSALGWAFQLQDARVILVLFLLVSAIAFNLAGLFELPVLAAGDGLAGKGGAMGSFWTGALAAFVATPCTGPFMAGALGAALVLPVPAAIAVFFGLGLGLALPFLLLGFVPALRHMLPRPGPWMVRLRHILALPMFATALGLAWILGRQAGVDAMAMGLAALLVLMTALWWVGRRQAQGRAGAWWPAAPGLVAALILAVVVVPRADAGTAQIAASANEERFSEARLAALRAEGRPVFLYFTADWCLSCKVNEKAAIDRAEVATAFEKAGVTVLVGDWTRGDADISRFLAAQGRSGVPLYLYYPKGAGEPQVLPQILTPSLLVALVA